MSLVLAATGRNTKNAAGNECAVAKRGKGVIPAKAGIHDINEIKSFWIPVCTGMTEKIISQQRHRLKKEGSEVVTKCNHLKMRASDGKEYVTDAADTEILLRLVQSIPSPNVEPFKLWLARVGYERIVKTIDPELAIQRGLQTYLMNKLDYSVILNWWNNLVENQTEVDNRRK